MTSTQLIDRRTLHDVRQSLAQAPAVALYGPRQVGKTTLAKELARELGDGGSVYLDLENPFDRAKLTEPAYYLSAHEDKLVILDEVQNTPDLFKVLRSLIDQGRSRDRRTGRFLILGSASMTLLKQSGESLAGRIFHVEMKPIDVLEAAEAEGADLSERLWLRGGFPDSLQADDDAASAMWRKNFIQAYQEREMFQLGARLPIATVQDFWHMLANRHGQVLNAAQLANALDVSSATIKHYLGLMVDLLLVRRLRPWRSNTGKRLVKSPKIYFRDSGIVHNLLNLDSSEQLQGSPVRGYSWEGFVIENILSCAPERTRESFYRTGNGAEIDLVLELPDNEIWAVEIKRTLETKVNMRSLKSVRDDLRPQRCLVVHSGVERFPLSEGVEAIGFTELCDELHQLN